MHRNQKYPLHSPFLLSLKRLKLHLLLILELTRVPNRNRHRCRYPTLKNRPAFLVGSSRG